MHIKGTSPIDKITVFFLNGMSVIFKILSLINLKFKSMRQIRYPGILIISIDNLSFGGTGKTSLVTEIGKNLEKKNVKFAIVTRGYKSKFENQGTNVQPHHNFNEVGDEAYIFKKRFPMQDIYVGKNRQMSIENAIWNQNKIILLDDGFQTTNIYRNIKIMLFNPNHPYYYLRNFKFLMKNEDFIFFYRFKTINKSQSVHGTYDFKIENFYDTKRKAVHIADASLFGFSALGDNFRFKNDLSAFNLKEFKAYSDHHTYTENEIKALNRLRQEKKIDFLVCTEKDFIKLKGMNLKDIPLIYAKNIIKLDIDLFEFLLEYAEKENYNKTSI